MERLPSLTLYDQYEKDYWSLHDQYLEEYTWSTDLMDKLPRDGLTPEIKEGDTYRSLPRQPNVDSVAWTLFKKYFGELNFIICKMEFAWFYKEWTLSNVEANIQELERFIKKALDVTLPLGDLTESLFGDNGVEIEYIKLKSDYYTKHGINIEGWSLGSRSLIARTYGKYILFYNFLLKQRFALQSTRQENAFSKQGPLKQLDMVLDWFANHKDAFPNTDFATIHKSLSEKMNYDCYANIIYEILDKLEQDGKITTWEANVTRYVGKSNIEVKDLIRKYAIKWEGRYFISPEVGGYQGEAISDNDANVRQAKADQRDKYLLLITYAIGAGTLIEGTHYCFDMFDFYEKHSWNWVRFSYLATGAVIGLLIWLTTWLLKKILSK